MHKDALSACRHELTMARSAFEDNDLDRTTHHLVRAHILGQRHLAPHLRVHAWMLRVALCRRDLHGIAGQALRLLLSLPGGLVGWVPLGNTGLADVPALKPMPLPADLAVYFENGRV